MWAELTIKPVTPAHLIHSLDRNGFTANFLCSCNWLMLIVPYLACDEQFTKLLPVNNTAYCQNIYKALASGKLPADYY